MICRQCLRASAGNLIPISSRTRVVSIRQTRALTSSPILTSPPTSSTATSSAQSLSATPPPSSANASADIKARPKPSSKTITRSTVPAGTPLKGLALMVNQPDPVAMEDREYPDWLWDVLTPKEKETAEGGSRGDEYLRSKKQRRAAAKIARREALANPEGVAPKIPIYEQSVDLPAGDGSVDGAVAAGLAREGLSAAMRDKRRAAIKETNMLKKMGAF
ncbi:hypothetical protein EJ05DRAFT_71621 [Pseudovirgaria hyperparasitica]|uniref:Large ribosomal subunit protein mL54 n=1 Tax=Pseudovirgaria hyperparasitica TaxID=470096 RepID=A0A6A6W165_9PEZI|nr:uncharacterized protein EJ05DRAFT_71621 [Pseudovirgaria hyperparasitica]KAF2756652.1 hypothetical protein EJ05DRAFT_71621 [Pseudovirgaria hyperparasitica]